MAPLKPIAGSRLLYSMNRAIGILVVFGSLVLPALAQDAAPHPVVVELFTSEGCSSCPPADALLIKLSQQRTQSGIDLILLGEHVDYWNYLGWTDRFSSSQFSQRQSNYAKAFHTSGPYTPQMVIDGRAEFVGNDTERAHQEIAQQAKQPESAKVALQWEGNRLHVSVQSADRGKVLLALTEDGLSTQVGSGENGGTTLHHAAVVRQLRDLGSLDKGKFDSQVDVPAPGNWNPARLKVIVLAQDPQTLHILGASEVAYQH